MMDNNIDEIIKLTTGKIDFFILQDNACSKNCPDDNLYYKYSAKNVFLKKKKEFHNKYKKKIENLDYYIKEYMKFNERKQVQLTKKKNVNINENDNLKEGSYKNKSSIEYDKKNGESKDNFSENNSNEFSDGSFIYNSDTSVSYSYDNLANWRYCCFNFFNININNNSSNNIFKENKNIFNIEELSEDERNELKNIYSTYIGLNIKNGVFFYIVNYCIMLGLERNRIDLLRNKMKNFQILYKFENVSKYTFLKNNLKEMNIIDNSDIYLIWKYANLFSNYSFIDENNFFQKNKTKKLFEKSFLQYQDYKKTIKIKKNCENSSNVEKENIKNNEIDIGNVRRIYKRERISFPRRNLEVICLMNKPKLKNILAITPHCYLDNVGYIYIKEIGDNRKGNNGYITHDKKLKKIKELLNSNKNNYFLMDDIYDNYLYFREIIYNLKSLSLFYNNNKKYKKKMIDDYKFIYKKINSNYIKKENQNKEKKTKVFLLLNREQAYYPYFFYEETYSYHFKGFSYIGEDYCYHEYPNYYINNIENKIYFILPLAYNYTFISIKNEPLCLVKGYRNKFSFYFPFDYKKKEVTCNQNFEKSKENYQKKNHDNNLNNIYSLAYNYLDDCIIACSRDYIFIFDINNPIYKKKITLLDHEGNKIGKMTSICLVHYYEEIQNNDNEMQNVNLTKWDEISNNKINETEMKNNKLDKNNIRKKNRKFLSKEHFKCRRIITKYLSKYEKKKKNIFFIGTKKGIIYVFNEKEERVDENENSYLTSSRCFVTLKNSPVIQITHYINNIIIASSLNDIYLREFNTNATNNEIKYYRENRDNQKYYFDILKDFLFTGDLYGNILIFDLKNKNIIFKKKLTYSPIICISINKAFPLMLLTTSYNFSHSVSNYIFKKNKKIIMYDTYKKKAIEKAPKSIFMASMSLWYIYELYNLYS